MWMQMRFRVAAEGERSCSVAFFIKKLKTSFLFVFVGHVSSIIGKFW